jgi:hypothetical protein
MDTKRKARTKALTVLKITIRPAFIVGAFLNMRMDLYIFSIRTNPRKNRRISYTVVVLRVIKNPARRCRAKVT